MILSQNPDTIAIWTDAGRNDAAGEVGITPLDDDQLLVLVGAPHSDLTWIALHWKMDIGPTPRILGDHWERGYGDLAWRGIVPERALPWYAIVQQGSSTFGVGVETGA